MTLSRGTPLAAIGLVLLAVGASRGQGKPGARIDPPAAAYLAQESLPDALLLLPPPPAQGTGTLARDEEASRAALGSGQSGRWTLAIGDADLASPAATAAMACAAGFNIGPIVTPVIDRLLRRTTGDLGNATYRAKARYARARPFMINGRSPCTPQYIDGLRKDGSYPSGHSAVGYGWGLILAEIVPERAAQLVARGRAFGDSRRYCNAHWLSDVEEGRVIAAAVVARLHADPGFAADLQAAKTEAARTRNVPPNRDCAAEAAALAG